MMCRRDNKDVPAWAVYDDEYLAQQMFTGDAGYGALPAEKELAIRQDDWRAGLGLETYDANDTKRYHKATMDMRFRGMGIAGWKSTAIAVDLTGYKTPTGGSGWTDNANSRDGDTSTKATHNWNAEPDTWSEYITNVIPSISATKIRYYFSRDSASCNSLEIDVYYSAAWHNIYTGAPALSTYTDVAFGSTQTVTQVRLRAYLGTNSASTNAYLHELDVYGDFTTKTTVCAAEFNDSLYLSRGPALIKLNGAGDGFGNVKHFAANITDLEVFSDSRLYIALGLSNAYWYMSTAEAFTKSSGKAAENFKYFAFVRTTADTMYGSDAVNKIRSCTTPVNGGAQDWGGQTTVDTSYHEITKLLSHSGALYIMKEDKPYYLSSAGAVQGDLAPELSALTKSTDNGKNAIIWLNNLYMPWGSQALVENDAGTNTWRSPSLFATNADEYNGQVFAVAGDDQYLYAILNYVDDVAVLSGRQETIDGTTGWVWHCINNTTIDGCETAFISTVFKKRLYFSSTTAAQGIYYIPLPTGYANVASDTNRAFLTGTTMETPWLHGNFKATTKGFPELILDMGHTYNAGRYFSVGYKKLGDSSWTTIGSGTLTNGTGTATGSPITLTGGANTVTVSATGTFTVVLPTGGGGLAVSGTGTLTSSPVTLVAGSNTITVSATGTIIVTTGVYMGTSTSMTQRQFIPTDSSSNNPSSTMFKLLFTAVTNDTTITPILLNYHLKGILYPDQREIIACKVYCANEIVLKDGTIDKGSFDTIVSTLNGARTATWPVTIYDINGDSATVKFLAVSSVNAPRWQVIGDEKNRGIETEYNVIMQKVTLS